jgi:hypothetical protein
MQNVSVVVCGLDTSVSGVEQMSNFTLEVKDGQTLLKPLKKLWNVALEVE